MFDFLQDFRWWRQRNGALERSHGSRQRDHENTHRAEVLQEARQSLRYKLEALHRRFQDQARRCRKMRRTTQHNPGFAERNQRPVEAYVTGTELARHRIAAQVRRLVDLPEQIEARGDRKIRIKFFRAGWLEYSTFVRGVEEGKFPLYALYQRPEGPVVQALPWSALVHTMTGISPRIGDIPRVAPEKGA